MQTAEPTWHSSLLHPESLIRQWLGSTFGGGSLSGFQGEVPVMLNAEVWAKIPLVVVLYVPTEAVSNPVLEQTAVGKISFRDKQPAVMVPEVTFGLLAIYIYGRYLLNTHSVQGAGLVLWGLEREEESTTLASGR